MKYKKYFRKTSLKQKGVGDFFLDEVEKKSPKTFLEVGVFHGVTARNICELLYTIHKDDFKYIGLDLFEESDENKSEVIPNAVFTNPLKNFYFRYIQKQNPYSKEAVEDLLKKFKDNVTLIKGNSNLILKKVDMSKIDYVFLDGGHTYKTVKNDLECCLDVINANGIVMCDDYNFGHLPDVKNAIDEFVKTNGFKCQILCDGRFAKIEK
ncbi:class I SAM-dependent methyltransferase [Pelagibacterales bacterium SAG-MED12]|nr:class I SAM-dependent methyltransferase [Pelagibacterales bacterium SAG-MED12]